MDPRRAMFPFPSVQTLVIHENMTGRNCLFRALGDQLEGHCRNHFRHRAEVVNFMRLHRTDFEPFVEDDVSFDDHVRNLQKLGTHAGNDAIVAFAKVNAVEVIIHQLNRKPFMISGPTTTSADTRQLHLAYHNGDHYSSVRRLGDNTESPAHIRLQETMDGGQNSLKKTQDYKGVVSAKRGLEDIETEVAIAAGCEDKEQVQQSLLECDYDVDAAIAFLLQQMEMSGDGTQDDSTSLASQQTSTTDSGVFNSLPASTSVSNSNSNSSSPTSSSSRHGGIMLRNSSTGSSADGEGGGILGGSVNGGKGLKVHFREDSFGGNSSGYGSMSSNKGGGARPKVMTAVPQQQVKLSGKKLKEMKKLEKKRKQEEKRREKVLGINNNSIYSQQYYIPHGRQYDEVVCHRFPRCVYFCRVLRALATHQTLGGHRGANKVFPGQGSNPGHLGYWY
ncbi:OTU domain-containing protein 3 [Elysia marginata]|uniref:OTU domain-containing protein 3 n=1 Tax=Elysia marginata TaxID=1093978 RepID=A0AAV4FNT9_9GAST|nr:OTU domain-containing protein 3 [Elysia marginata]